MNITGALQVHGRLALAGAGIVAAAAIAGGIEPAGLAGAGAASPRPFAALAAGAIVSAAVLPFVIRRGASRRVWPILAIVALAAGIAAFLIGARMQRDCTVRYGGRALIGGTELTPSAAAYAAANPELSRDELLFDARGVVESIWTRSSIDRCRLRVRATYFLWIPFLTICLIATTQAVPPRMFSVAARDLSPGSSVARIGAHAESPAPVSRYDVFLSYRHGGADMDTARQLLETLEAQGYRVAIDERDFAANESFLEEMERCIRESRFTVAIISGRYLESGHCQEEAIVCKVLDMGERRRRLIPFVLEPVSMPAWLYGLVGIYCTKAHPLVDPIEKLTSTLGPPLSANELTSGR